MQNSITTGNRKSTLGKLYDKVHKEYEEDEWVRDLVKGIQNELSYAIQVENQKLPIHCLSINFCSDSICCLICSLLSLDCKAFNSC